MVDRVLRGLCILVSLCPKDILGWYLEARYAIT